MNMVCECFLGERLFKMTKNYQSTFSHSDYRNVNKTIDRSIYCNRLSRLLKVK